jgi:hypothetical protein
VSQPLRDKRGTSRDKMNFHDCSESTVGKRYERITLVFAIFDGLGYDRWLDEALFYCVNEN